MENFTIEPLKGFGDIKFGMSIDEVIKQIGEPTNYEELEPLIDESENYCVLYEYKNKGFSLYFEGITSTVLSNISTENKDATLFGERVYSMNREQIIAFMKKNGYKDFAEENEEGDDCIIYDDLMLDFYFKEGKLIDVLWGVIVDSQGDIIK